MHDNTKIKCALDRATLAIVPACYVLLGALWPRLVRAILPMDAIIAFDAVMAACGLLVWRRVRVERGKRYLTVAGKVGCMSFCLAMFLVAQCAATIVYALTQDAAFTAYGSASHEGNVWGAVIVTVVMAPTVEEILFRGVVFEALGRYVSLRAAALISSVGFAAAHGTLVHMLPATLMALTCCVVYVVTGRLSCSVMVHAAYNVFSIVAPMIPVAKVLFVPLVTLPACVAMGAACVMGLKHTELLRARLCKPKQASSAVLEQCRSGW